VVVLPQPLGPNKHAYVAAGLCEIQALNSDYTSKMLGNIH